MSTSVRFRTVDVSDPQFETDGVRHVCVRSPALGRRADISVYAPPGAPEGLPAVILLHGVYGSHWGWTRSGGAHRTLARLIDAGEVQPMALVMPSDGLFGDGSGYVNEAETWVVDEVLRAARFAVPGAGDGGVCIAGLSMGGYGALRLAGKFPDNYVAAAGMSSITHLDQMKIFVAEDVPVTYPLTAAEQGVADVLVAAGDRVPRLRIDCGTEDLLIEQNRALHAALDAAGVAHDYVEYPGGHEWAYWRDHLDDVLRFFDDALRRPNASQ
jgi:S-formylglutathione hydrolase FrmB